MCITKRFSFHRVVKMKKLLIFFAIAYSWSSFGGTPLFKFKDRVYTNEALSPALKQLLYEAEKQYHDQLTRVVEQSILTTYIHDRARSEKKTVKAIEKKLFTVAQPTDKETKNWFDQNKSRLGGREREREREREKE